jgi:branched-subunit amino acid transport protein
MSGWISVIAAGVAVYALRSLLLLGRFQPPAAVERILAYVAPASLAALVAPALLASSATWTAVGPRAAALTAGAVVAHRTRSIGVTVVGGMVVLWIVTAACSGLS